MILLPKIPWVLHTSISRVWWAVENSLSPWAAGRMLCSRVSLLFLLPLQTIATWQLLYRKWLFLWPQVLEVKCFWLK